MTIDSVIIGFNGNSKDYITMIKSMGRDSGAYRDLSLAIIDYENKSYTALDLLTHFYYQNKPLPHKPFHNADFLNPAILYLCTYLMKKGFSTTYVNLFHLEKDKLKAILLNHDILTIAITTTLYVSLHPILEIISFIKKYNKRAKIVVGGPYVLNQAETEDKEAIQSHFKYIGADFYVISTEGEAAYVNILSALKNGGQFDQIANIAYKKDDAYVFTYKGSENSELEQNMVDYSLFPKKDIGELLSLRTAKSCPFMCAFCGYSKRAGKYKYMDIDHVQKELNAIREIGGVTTLTFIDDTFNVTPKRFKEILKMMIRNKYGFKWNSYYRCDHGDEETINLMKEAGCEGVFLGVESGSDTILKQMNKTARRADYLKAIPLLRRVGITTHANLLIGFPGETMDTVKETIDLIEMGKPDYFRAQLWYADPMTPVWNKRKAFEINGAGFTWSHYTMDSRTASDLVEKMFLSVQNATWLPQYGFELWSVFYLQRKGMTKEQVKRFITCFNGVIKEKLLHLDKKNVVQTLWESLKNSCQFDAPSGNDNAAVDVLSGSRYLAAEKFWIKEFPSASWEHILDLLPDKISSTEETWESFLKNDSQADVKPLQSVYQTDLAIIFVAVYGVALSRMSRKEEIPVVLATNYTDSVCTFMPMKLCPTLGLSFSEFVTNVSRNYAQALLHQPYAFHILTTALSPAERDNGFEAFDAGYIYNGMSQPSGSKGFEIFQQNYPTISQKLGLVLEITCQSSSLDMCIWYKKSRIHFETIRQLDEDLTAITNDISQNHDVSLAEMIFGASTMETFLGNLR